MPPKKKQEEIDLATLPECKTLNSIILIRGRKARAQAIQQRLQKQCEKFVTRVRKAEVLDHAKQKGIYVDPATLTDKQKKDPKFMESVSTELTAEVVAKAVKSHLAALTLKARIEKKNNAEKVQDDKGRKYDVLYVFEDFPDTTGEFQELAKCGQNVRYVLVIEPKVSWANAPELPEAGQQQEQQEEEVKEYKALLKKEEATQEDIDFQSQVDKRVAQIRQLRRSSKQDSQFRNCTISAVEADIDPYSEDNSITELIKLFLENVNKLNADVAQFEEWRKDRKAESLGEAVQVDHHPPQGKLILGLLDSMAQGLDEKPANHSQGNAQEEDIMNLINSFSTSSAAAPLTASSVSSVEDDKKELFVGANEYVGENADLLAEIRQHIKFPGINRFQMPQIPSKSQKLRKLHQSQYALFLKNNLDLNEFFRRQQMLNFEQYIKQFDEERTYSFSDRIYEQHHDRASLERELYRALQFNEYSTFSKYDENSDKLYLMLVYRNNPRRVSRKLWEGNWKVLPNYEAWLTHFKNNQNNLNNTNFYDIDYEKIGNIEENTRAHTLKNGENGAVIINKEFTVSNNKQHLLYAIKKNFVFGVQNGKFFGQNGKVRIYHLQNEQKTYETVILLPEYTIRLLPAGNVLVEKGTNSRMVTPNGYTILYDQSGSTILHPTGGITYNSNTYTNDAGLGLKDGHLFSCPALKRRIEGGQIIKRDDNTVIVNSLQGAEVKQKWIKFFDGTEYQVSKGKVKIQRQGEPFITCQNGNIRILADQLSIRITARSDGYTSVVQFPDGNNVRVSNEKLYVFQAEQEGQIAISIKDSLISSKFGAEEVKVSPYSSIYLKNGKQFDARQDEQKYGEEDALPSDYIQPRLFVINNDNSAVQLISDKMYQSYLKQHQQSIDKVYQKKNANCTECHVVAKENITRGKQISNSLCVNLDVYDNTNETPQKPSHTHISLKTYLRHDPLTPDAIADMHRIKTQIQAWRKQNAKEENEFGYRQPRDPATKGKIQAKLLTLKKRQEKQPRVKCESLRETARNFHLTTYQQIQKQLQRQNREKQLRTQFMKKKNSVIRQYKKINISKEGRRSQDQPQVVEEFMDHYFMTAQGIHALSEMPDWVFRPKEIKAPVELDPEIQQQLNNTNGVNREEQSEERRERYDTVEVNLNPKPQKEIYIKPSVFTQRQIDEERSAFEQEKKAYKYHEGKRKDFNVYGQERKSKPEVPTLLRTQPISEINQKYLVTEAPLDKKVKISSMKNKLTSSASSMVEMRKEGPHTLLMKTIDKGNDINRLLERRTMMVQADLNDKLQRDILINPVEANFGPIVQRKTYEFKIQIKNEDVISQRITLKRPKSIHVKVQLNQMGLIAMGMIRKVIVTIKASPQIIGKFTDEFDIVTKHEIYHIPITAHIISENQARNQGFILARGVTEVQQNGKKKNESSFELPRITK